MAVLYLDVTKSRKQSHYSGLRRLRMGLERGLGSIPELKVVPCRWSYFRCGYVEASTCRKIPTGPEAAFVTPEVFAPGERPGYLSWLGRFAGRTAAIYYDAIPFTHPEISWPKSVRRFGPWFRGLPYYDTIFYISREAMREAAELSQRFAVTLPSGRVFPLGADYWNGPKERLEGERRAEPRPVFLSTGIIEPRKGYTELLDAAEALWERGRLFQLVILGRVNPWHGKEIAARMAKMRETGREILHESKADDTRLAYWHARASLVVQPSHAEGFGLPVLEALWAGCPVLCSRQPSLERVPGARGVSILPEVTAAALRDSLERFLDDPGRLEQLERAVESAEMPTWADAAKTLYAHIQEGQ